MSHYKSDFGFGGHMAVVIYLDIEKEWSGLQCLVRIELARTHQVNVQD